MTDIYTRFTEHVAFRMRMDKSPAIMNMTWLLGLFGETGEVVDLIKKHVGHSHPFERSKMVKELGDVEWYLEAIRQAYGFKRVPVEDDCVIYGPNPEISICEEARNLATDVGFALSCSNSTMGDYIHFVDERLAAIYARFSITREEALEANIKKLTERYPNGFNTQDSINRKDVQT